MTLLTPGEYDDLPQDAKDALAGVVRHPRNDQKSSHYRQRYGRFRNGDLSGDPISGQIIGYGTGSPFASVPNTGAGTGGTGGTGGGNGTPPPVIPDPTFVQGAALPSTGSASTEEIDLAFTQNVTEGNRLVVALGGHPMQGSPEAWTVSDTMGNVWQKDAEAWLNGQILNGWIGQLWSCKAKTSGPDQVSWTLLNANEASSARLLIHELGGVDTLDFAVEASGLSAALSSGLFTLNHDKEFMLAWLVHNQGIDSTNWPQLETSSTEATAGQAVTVGGQYQATATALGADSWLALVGCYYYTGV